MKATQNEIFSAKVVTLAVQGALLVMFSAPIVAYADDKPSDEVTALTHPVSSIDIGPDYVSSTSAKFGEYNGYNKMGAGVNGDFSIRGGDAYNAQSGGEGTKRWEVKGNDLGTSSRGVGGSVSDQGKWSFGIDYDQLQHNITDTYETPFLGPMGGNNFVLPSNFGAINTAAKPAKVSPYLSTTANFATAPGTNELTAAQQAALNPQDVHSDRQNTNVNAKYNIDTQWDVKFDFTHIKQSGAKLQGVAGDQVNGSVGALTFAGQTPMVIMNPTNYTTDNINLALNWMGDKGYATASYYVSMFRDAYNSVSFDNPFYKAGTFTTGTTLYGVDAMSTMPSNDFHQLNLNGGYSFASSTKLVGGLSYGLNTQNDAYAQQGLTPFGFPQNSLNGTVATIHADLKLTDQTTKDLLLSAGLKFNERDNQTASNEYQFYTINQAGISTPGTSSTYQTSWSTPMSNKKTQLELAGDYRIDKSQKLRISYEYEKINRWCNSGAWNNAQSTFNAAATGVTAYTATTCAQVPESQENKFVLNYKLKATDDLSLNAGYGYSNRNSDINPLFYNPMQAYDPNGANATPLPNSGGSNGEGYEVPGFVAYFDASRKEQLLKAGANWQANDKLTFTLSTRYTDDNYDSTYGVQKGTSWSLNLDSTYNYTENGSVSAYATSQNMTRDMTNLQNTFAATATAASATALNVPVGATWTNTLKENDTTFGLGAKQGGFMAGKLDLSGDLTYSLGKSSYDTEFNYANATTTGLTCSSAYFMTCGALPNIRNELLQLKLAGNYKIDKSSKIRLGYVYQQLRSVDYLYNGYQYGSTPSTLLPTNQQAPSYSVNLVSVSYAYSF